MNIGKRLRGMAKDDAIAHSVREQSKSRPLMTGGMDRIEKKGPIEAPKEARGRPPRMVTVRKKSPQRSRRRARASI